MSFSEPFPSVVPQARGGTGCSKGLFCAHLCLFLRTYLQSFMCKICKKGQAHIPEVTLGMWMFPGWDNIHSYSQHPKIHFTETKTVQEFVHGEQTPVTEDLFDWTWQLLTSIDLWYRSVNCCLRLSSKTELNPVKEDHVSLIHLYLISQPAASRAEARLRSRQTRSRTVKMKQNGPLI